MTLPPYRRTVALAEWLLGRVNTTHEYLWLLATLTIAGLAVGVFAAVVLPLPALIILLGLCIAALIWVTAAAVAHTRYTRGR